MTNHNTLKQPQKPRGLLGDFNILNIMNRDGNLLRLSIITASIFIIMSILNPDRFLTLRNFSSMSFQFPEFGLLSIAIMITMLTGGIDLSVVSIANLSGVLAALVLTKFVPAESTSSQIIIVILVALIVSIITGVVCGLLNGFLIAKVGITPILATLGTMQLFTGIAIVITKGPAFFGFPDQFLFIGNGTIFGIPLPLIVFIIFAVIVALILDKTTLGFNIYMMGTNPTASHFSGINNKLVLIKTYMLSGFLSAVAGIVIIARTNSAKADYGSSYVLQAILVAVLGGVNPNGGFGKISGLLLAILSLQFLSSGFNMLRFNNFFKEFIWGAVLLLVMVVNYYSAKRRG